jgi:nucleoid-associated protein YgaU
MATSDFQQDAAGASAKVDAAGAEDIGGAQAKVDSAGGDVHAAGEVTDAGIAKAQAAVDVAGSAIEVGMDAVDMAAGAVIGAVSVIGSLIPASLRCTTPPNIGFVPFDFNPDKITMSRSSNSGNVTRPARPDANPIPGGGGTSGSVSSYPKQVKASTIKMDIILEGPFTKLRCDTLLTWMNPKAGLFAMFAAGRRNFSSQPAKLTFQWGPPMIGFMYDVKLTSCTVIYDRFTPAGIPIRASISMQMEEIPTKLGSLPTNPTSGGLPGRRTHTVAHGESLHSIAMETYGTPGLWRRIAEVNRINDPTRVRAGTTIYLPNADELVPRSTT